MDREKYHRQDSSSDSTSIYPVMTGLMEQAVIPDRVSVRRMPFGCHAASSEPRQREVLGEFMLLCAMIEEAIQEYQKYALSRDRRGMRLFQEVEDWFFTDDFYWPFSFVNICSFLRLDADYVREGLRLWKRDAVEIQSWDPKRTLKNDCSRQKKIKAA